MKPIQVENNHDCTVSVQVIQTEITGQHGTHLGPKEICLLIEDETGDHVATFTPQQATELMRALHLASAQITGNNSEKTN